MGFVKRLVAFVLHVNFFSKWRPMAISPSLLHLGLQRHQKLSESKVQSEVDSRLDEVRLLE